MRVSRTLWRKNFKFQIICTYFMENPFNLFGYTVLRADSAELPRYIDQFSYRNIKESFDTLLTTLH